MRKILLPLLFLSGTLLFGEAPGVSFTIIPGTGYVHRHWFGPLPVSLTPQIALWLEDGEGHFLETLYLTERSARNSWRGAGEGRSEALPLYSHARNASEDVEGVSGASVRSGEIGRRADSPYSGMTLLVRAEVNSSFDYNSSYTRENSGVNGQPSLLYEGLWKEGEREIGLRPVGTGSLTGDTGEAGYSLEGLTTALEMVESITLLR